ncbi:MULTISPECIES: putative DNA-binding domain-containing protein [unclassified Lysobacter]|uniref:HvfC family RiPP maturation protein n=1 Tax=unclassified Lysobacter TaxID=2635362 RepID=UPI001C2163B8|nr:putative DNA-binding domain-containing protein [Lysobacter sp. MMG2]MBU8977848.1 putative DNA-binding domain-containing protein [Lysobacter sp. MMG2]
MHELRQQQYTLARHLRDPSAHPPPPGLEPRRVKVYAELFFNSIEGLLSGGFPVIRQTLGTTAWKALVREFYANHRSRTPLFPQVAGEFVDYLDERADDTTLPPWLPELAHYEWIEQLLLTHDASHPLDDADIDPLDGVLRLSPLAMPLAYRWPVTEIGPDFVPDAPPPEATTLVVHRDADHEVRFVRIAPLVYHLLVSIQAHARSGRGHLLALADEAGVDPIEFQAHALPVLHALRAQGVVFVPPQLPHLPSPNAMESP